MPSLQEPCGPSHAVVTKADVVSSAPREQYLQRCGFSAFPSGSEFCIVSIFWRGFLHPPFPMKWQPTPVLLPGKSHGQRSLVGCSPWGHKESDTTEQLRFHFSLSCIGEGNGNPLQSSCLENPRDGGAWWATVYGVTQSRTRLKQQQQQSFSLPITARGLW